jgi:hypothetical protein
MFFSKLNKSISVTGVSNLAWNLVSALLAFAILAWIRNVSVVFFNVTLIVCFCSIVSSSGRYFWNLKGKPTVQTQFGKQFTASFLITGMVSLVVCACIWGDDPKVDARIPELTQIFTVSTFFVYFFYSLVTTAIVYSVEHRHYRETIHDSTDILALVGVVILAIGLIRSI